MERQLKHGGYPGLSYLCGNTHQKDPRDEPRYSKRGGGCRHRIPSILKLLIKKINITGNNPLTRQWWYDVMTLRPPPLPKKEENNRKIILDLVEEGWIEGDWTKTMPRLLNDLLQEKFISASKMTPTRVACINEGVQWIRMEELGKALTNRCRGVRDCHKRGRKISSEPETEVSTVNSSNLNANLEHLQGVASMSFWS